MKVSQVIFVGVPLLAMMSWLVVWVVGPARGGDGGVASERLHSVGREAVFAIRSSSSKLIRTDAAATLLCRDSATLLPIAGAFLVPAAQKRIASFSLADADPDSRSNDDGRILLQQSWAGRGYLLAAPGYRCKAVALDDRLSNQIVDLDRGAAASFRCAVDGKPLSRCCLLLSDRPMVPSLAIALQGSVGETPVFGDCSSSCDATPAVWMSVSDANGLCIIDGLELKPYFVFAASDYCYPVEARYTGTLYEAPQLVVNQMTPIEFSDFYGSAVAAATEASVRSFHAIVPHDLVSKEASTFVLARHVQRRAELRLGTNLLRTAAPVDFTVIDKFKATWVIGTSDGSIWQGTFPMVPLRLLDTPAILEKLECKTGIVHFELRCPGGNHYEGSLSVVPATAGDGPRPPVKVRNGEEVWLPVGDYTWEFDNPNPWAESPRLAFTVESERKKKVVIDMMDAVLVRIAPAIEANALDVGAHVTIESSDGSMTYVWREERGVLEAYLPRQDYTISMTCFGRKKVVKSISFQQMVHGMRMDLSVPNVPN